MMIQRLTTYTLLCGIMGVLWLTALPASWLEAAAEPWTPVKKDHPVHVILQVEPLDPVMESSPQARVLFSIPIPDHSNLKDTSKIVLLQGEETVMRVLDRWPSGNIRWIQVDALTSTANRQWDKVNFVLTAGDGRNEVSQESLAARENLPRIIARGFDPQWYNICGVLSEKLVAESLLTYVHRVEKMGARGPLRTAPTARDPLHRALIDYFRLERAQAFEARRSCSNLAQTSRDALDRWLESDGDPAELAPILDGLLLWSRLEPDPSLEAKLTELKSRNFGDPATEKELSKRLTGFRLTRALAMHFDDSRLYDRAWQWLKPLAIDPVRDGDPADKSGQSLERGAYLWRGQVLSPQDLEDWLREILALFRRDVLSAERTLALRRSAEGVARYVEHELIERVNDQAYFKTAAGRSCFGPESAVVLGFYATGDSALMDLARALLKGRAATENSCIAMPGGREGADLLHLLRFVKAYPVWRDVPLGVDRLAENHVRLSWTVPAGARTLELLGAFEPIVDSLAFDAARNAYLRDPGKHRPRFAATVLPETPLPYEDGQRQTLELVFNDTPLYGHFRLRALEIPLGSRTDRPVGPQHIKATEEPNFSGGALEPDNSSLIITGIIGLIVAAILGGFWMLSRRERA